MKYKINLLSFRKEKPLDRVIYFVLNYLRYILVITQIVVIGVFFYRFKIDQELVDLQEAYDQKKEIIEVAQPLVKEGKKEAFKIDQVKKIILKQQTFIDSIDYLLSLFPESFFLNDLNISDNNLLISGYTQDPQSINNFLNRLKKESKFEKIELKKISKAEQGLEFSFSLNKFKNSQSM